MDFLEKENALPQEIKSFFRSNEIRWELEKACFLYGIPHTLIKNISGPIGLMYVGDYKLQELPDLISKNLKTEEKTTFGLAVEINKRLFNKFPDYFKDSQRLLQKWETLKSAPLISEEEAWQKVLEIEPWILEEKDVQAKELEEKKKREEEKRKQYLASLVTMTLQQALKEYPEIGEQLVTSSHIKLKNFPDPVRPSIKNWIADYAWQLGHGRHNSMERSNYIFQGANAKTLNPQDRQKLSYLLKSLDENIPITVNKNTKQVAFEKITSDMQKAARHTEQTLPGNTANIVSLKPQAQALRSSSPAAAWNAPRANNPQLPQRQIQNPVKTPSRPVQKQNIFPQSNIPKTRQSEDSNIKFSFPQKLSYEKNQLKPTFPPPQINSGKLPKQPQGEKKDERMMGKNVVNLKE